MTTTVRASDNIRAVTFLPNGQRFESSSARGTITTAVEDKS